MQTYVLTRLSCAKPASWACRLVRFFSGSCRCTSSQKSRADFCAVRAESPEEAATMLGGRLSGLSSMAMWPCTLDQGMRVHFTSGPETYAIVAKAFYRLRHPPVLRPTLTALSDAERDRLSRAPESDGYLRMELASLQNYHGIEAALLSALVNDGRNELCLVVVPELALVASMEEAS